MSIRIAIPVHVYVLEYWYGNAPRVYPCTGTHGYRYVEVILQYTYLGTRVLVLELHVYTCTRVLEYCNSRCYLCTEVMYNGLVLHASRVPVRVHVYRLLEHTYT